MPTQPKTNLKMEKIIQGIIQTIIAGGIIWMASTINRLDTTLSALQERTKNLEDIRPALNSLQMSQEEMKERLIRVEDNQHHKLVQ